MKEKIILIGLDALSIILAFSLIIFSLCVITYSFNPNTRYMFMGIGVISTIVLYNSIIEIVDEKK